MAGTVFLMASLSFKFASVLVVLLAFLSIATIRRLRLERGDHVLTGRLCLLLAGLSLLSYLLGDCFYFLLALTDPHDLMAGLQVGDVERDLCKALFSANAAGALAASLAAYWYRSRALEPKLAMAVAREDKAVGEAVLSAQVEA